MNQLTYSIWRIAGSNKHYVINHSLKQIHSAWDSSIEAHEVYKRLNKNIQKENRNKTRLEQETNRTKEAKKKLVIKENI